MFATREFRCKRICFDEEWDIPDNHEEQNKAVTELCRCGKCGVMDINMKGLCSAKLKPWV